MLSSGCFSCYHREHTTGTWICGGSHDRASYSRSTITATSKWTNPVTPAVRLPIGHGGPPCGLPPGDIPCMRNTHLRSDERRRFPTPSGGAVRTTRHCGRWTWSFVFGSGPGSTFLRDPESRFLFRRRRCCCWCAVSNRRFLRAFGKTVSSFGARSWSAMFLVFLPVCSRVDEGWAEHLV